MITEIEGKLKSLSENSIILSVGGIYYEIFVSPNVIKNLKKEPSENTVHLVTYHYLQSDPSRSLPVLIGFNNRIERDFFEKFITVSGIGPKAALKALSVPISQIACAIDASDTAFLKTLPGVGDQRAREIVAKLQGRVGRFALIQDGGAEVVPDRKDDAVQEALSVLHQLQYKRDEAKAMIDRALQNNKNLQTVEEILNEVYRQRNTQPTRR